MLDKDRKGTERDEIQGTERLERGAGRHPKTERRRNVTFRMCPAPFVSILISFPVITLGLFAGKRRWRYRKRRQIAVRDIKSFPNEEEIVVKEGKKHTISSSLCQCISFPWPFGVFRGYLLHIPNPCLGIYLPSTSSYLPESLLFSLYRILSLTSGINPIFTLTPCLGNSPYGKA